MHKTTRERVKKDQFPPRTKINVCVNCNTILTQTDIYSLLAFHINHPNTSKIPRTPNLCGDCGMNITLGIGNPIIDRFRNTDVKEIKRLGDPSKW